MKRVVTTALLCLVTGSLAGQMKPAPQPAPTSRRSPLVASGARTNAPTFSRISVADAMKLYKSGQAVFVDVRSNEQYQIGHIKGALSIPRSQIVRRFAEVPPRKTVILYCACSAEQSSGVAAADLMAHGVKNVFALKGGWAEWKNAGHPTAVGPK